MPHDPWDVGSHDKRAQPFVMNASSLAVGPPNGLAAFGYTRKQAGRLPTSLHLSAAGDPLWIRAPILEFTACCLVLERIETSSLHNI